LSPVEAGATPWLTYTQTPRKPAAVPPQLPSIETSYSWIRLVVSITLSTLGCVGMWSLVVVLPAVQADFNAPRADATLPYTLATIGFMIGGIIVGRLADRFGIVPPLAGGTILMSLGYVLTASAPNLSVFAVISGVTIGLGGAASFAPLVADASLWFDRHRGLAISLATAGSSLAGVVWPPIVQHSIAAIGWRQTHIGIGIFCLATMLPLSLVLLRRPVFHKATLEAASTGNAIQAIGLAPRQPPGQTRRANTRLGVIHFRFSGVFATSRTQSMKICATGLSARVFRVTIPFGTRALGR
jgi:MFS family permease